MATQRLDITPFLNQEEGQHFERKSLFQGPEGSKRPRDRRLVRDQVAEYVAAFANAEGGVLILGLEDDGNPTGHGFPPAAIKALLEVPGTRLMPPQPTGFLVEHQGNELLVFDIPICDVPVQVDGNGFPLRMGDRTVQASETQIRALKFRGLAESWEAQPSHLTLADLDATTLAQARAGAGLAAMSDEDYLLKRKLADRRGRNLILRRAAELLFAAAGPDHPNAGVRVFRVIGNERRLGVEHNVEEKPRIEGKLPQVIESAFQAVELLIRRPSRLRGTRFQEVPEYPDFSWKEAILNAVAHRDYSSQGRTTEVWFFEDRLEITNPGGLIPDLTLAELLRLERRHMSRNPRLVRVLVDLGIMRDQGEGIPRMFAEMEGMFLPAPTIEVRPNEFAVTLRNTPTLTDSDRSFVAAIGSLDLSEVEFRALLDAHRRGRLENSRLRELTGLDTLAASALLRRLRDRGLLTLHAAGPNSYYELGPALESIPKHRGDWGGVVGERRSEWGGSSTDWGGFVTDWGELRPQIDPILASLKVRPRKELLRNAILQLAQLRVWKPADLAEVLGTNPKKLVERHLSPMVAEGLLERLYPDNKAHPAQAYRAAKRQAGQRADPENC